MAKYTAHVVRYSYARQMQEMVNIHNLFVHHEKSVVYWGITFGNLMERMT